MLLLLLLLGIAEHLLAQPPFFTPCNFDELVRCQSVFNDQLGITPYLDWKTATQLRYEIEGKYVSNQAQGILAVCRAFKGMKTCFSAGSAGYDNCMNALGLLIDGGGNSTGVTLKQAYDYVKVYTQFDFACGAGFSIFANNVACMAERFTATNATLQQCVASFEQNAVNDPPGTCSYALTATRCFATSFRSCGLGPAYWACEYERTGTGVRYPQCTENYCRENAPIETEKEQ